MKPYQFDIKGSSDESESDDDEEPDPSSRREPNKFDNLCDGVTNTMAYVHGAMQEVVFELATLLCKQIFMHIYSTWVFFFLLKYGHKTII